MKVGARVALSV